MSTIFTTFIGGLIWATVLLFVIGIFFLPRVRYNPKKGLRLRLSIFNYKFDVLRMELRNNQFVFGQLVGTDDRGDQAPLDGTTVEATIDDTDKAEVSLDAEDPTMITVTAKRAGATVLRLKAKAKDVNGDGNVAEFSTEIALQITSGEAVGLGVNFGQPEDQPAAEA